ncbi:MAG TPA: peptidoglycan DD-metalloendopeptidase family protein [Actinomycetota bacterium]|nr:peptidoglycan DD-metalloendopeptidase family protein [Actinomycetota bacterium]
MISSFPVDGTWKYSPSSRQLKRNGVLVRYSFFKSRPSGIHGAVDITRVPQGTPLLAVTDGVVRRLGNQGDKGWGRYARIAGADGHDYLLAHLSAYAPGIKVGSKVKAGQPVALCGSTGNSEAPHDHREIWWKRDDRDTRVDPYWMFCWLAQGKGTKTNPYAEPNGERLIEYGDIGEQVMWVQWALAYPAVTGRFNKAVRGRLEAFQTKHGLKATGAVDEKTLVALRQVTR